LGLEVKSFRGAFNVDVVIPDQLRTAEGGLELAGDQLNSHLIALRVVAHEGSLQRERLAFEEISERLIGGDGIGEDTCSQFHAPIEVLVYRAVEREACSDARAPPVRRFDKTVE